MHKGVDDAKHKGVGDSKHKGLGRGRPPVGRTVSLELVQEGPVNVVVREGLLPVENLSPAALAAFAAYRRRRRGPAEQARTPCCRRRLCAAAAALRDDRGRDHRCCKLSPVRIPCLAVSRHAARRAFVRNGHGPGSARGARCRGRRRPRCRGTGGRRVDRRRTSSTRLLPSAPSPASEERGQGREKAERVGRERTGRGQGEGRKRARERAGKEGRAQRAKGQERAPRERV